MEALIICAAVFFVMGVAVGASLRGMQGRGGWTVTLDGQTWHFTSQEVQQIFALLTRTERVAVARADQAGVIISDTQRAAAQTALEQAARRWLQAHPEEAARKLGQG